MPTPEEFNGPTYSIIMHGVGLADEWPMILRDKGEAPYGFKGVIEPGMAFCVEVLMGKKDYGECMKLEE